MEGHELVAIRRRLGWTQKELAERVGVDRNTLWRWEKERRVPEPAARLIRRIEAEVTQNAAPGGS